VIDMIFLVPDTTAAASKHTFGQDIGTYKVSLKKCPLVIETSVRLVRIND